MPRRHSSRGGAEAGFRDAMERMLLLLDELDDLVASLRHHLRLWPR
jgi:hypothetical protein